jgi:hypothetical protein
MDYHNPEPGSFWLGGAILEALETRRPSVDVSLLAKVQQATENRHTGRVKPAISGRRYHRKKVQHEAEM